MDVSRVATGGIKGGAYIVREEMRMDFGMSETNAPSLKLYKFMSTEPAVPALTLELTRTITIAWLVR